MQLCRRPLLSLNSLSRRRQYSLCGKTATSLLLSFASSFHSVHDLATASNYLIKIPPLPLALFPPPPPTTTFPPFSPQEPVFSKRKEGREGFLSHRGKLNRRPADDDAVVQFPYQRVAKFFSIKWCTFLRL